MIRISVVLIFMGMISGFSIGALSPGEMNPQGIVVDTLLGGIAGLAIALNHYLKRAAGYDVWHKGRVMARELAPSSNLLEGMLATVGLLFLEWVGGIIFALFFLGFLKIFNVKQMVAFTLVFRGGLGAIVGDFAFRVIVLLIRKFIDDEYSALAITFARTYNKANAIENRFDTSSTQRALLMVYIACLILGAIFACALAVRFA